MVFNGWSFSLGMLAGAFFILMLLVITGDIK